MADRKCALPGTRVTEPDDDLGVKESPADWVDHPIVDRRAWDDSEEPRREIRAISPGDYVTIDGKETKIVATGKRSNYGQEGLYRISPEVDFIGTVCSLYVDRDPYLLNVCNGPILTIAPEKVTVNQ